jgi:hypothetical protein
MVDFATILITVSVLLVVQAIVIFYFFRKRADMKARGEILEDEFTQKVKHRAGYNTYWISWFIWLGIFVVDSLGILSGTGEIKPNWAIWTGAMVMWAIYNTNILLLRRDKKD